MSTSSRSTHPDGLRPRRRHWAAGIAAALALTLTVIWSGAGRDPGSELRVAATGDTLSASLVDGDHVIHFANAERPADARAALGVLARPWERQPGVVIAGASERIANGLWETLQRLSPRQLIVLGAPGDSEQWLTIERYCRDAGIELRYLESPTRLELTSLSVTLVPSESESHAIIANGQMRVALAVGGLPADGRYHALIGDGNVPASLSADLVVTPTGIDPPGDGVRTLTVEEGRRVTLVFEAAAIRVRGGNIAVGRRQ